MKTRFLFELAVAGTLLVSVAGCFRGPHGVPDRHANDDPPIVVTDAPAGISSLEFDITFRGYDVDSDEAIFWDECPNPNVEGATPILTVSYSVNGGSTFNPIDPADLQFNGQPIVVPTCSQVANFDSDIRIAVSTSGEQHTFTWSSLDYVPTSAEVIFRIALDDGSFTSEPGDSEEFIVANVPAFTMGALGARPGQTLVGLEFTGLLTSWDGTTVAGSADNLTLTNFTPTSNTEATGDLTMGGDTEQTVRVLQLITPGAGLTPPGSDEVAEGSIWTCNVLGMPVVEFETSQIGNGPQFICDQGDFTLEGDFASENDRDVYMFVAASDGNYSFSFDWTGGVDYDLIFTNADQTALHGPGGPFGCGECCSEAKPEVCTVEFEAGTTYRVIVDLYAGPPGSYDLTANAP